MSPKGPLVAFVLLAVGLAGCIGGIADPANRSNDSPQTADASETVTLANGTDDPTRRAHVHDRWEGQDQRTLLDDQVEMPAVADPAPDDVFDWMSRAFCIERRFSLPDGEIVPPGTDELTVTLAWESTDPRDIDEVDLAYIPADGDDWEEEPGIRSGDSVPIDTSVEMADGGHAQASLWMFRLTHCFGSPEHYTGLTVDVQIVADRVDGPLPLEPPHPDWWRNGSSLQIYHNSGSGEEVGAGYLHLGINGGSGDYIDGSDHEIVPVGTRSLVLTLNWTNDSPAADATSITPEVEWVRGGGFFSDWHAWEAETLEDGHAVYGLPVSESMTDGLYAKNSRWRFDVDLEGSQPASGVAGIPGPEQPYHFDGRWEIEIAAHDTPPSETG